MFIVVRALFGLCRRTSSWSTGSTSRAFRLSLEDVVGADGGDRSLGFGARVDLRGRSICGVQRVATDWFNNGHLWAHAADWICSQYDISNQCGATFNSTV